MSKTLAKWINFDANSLKDDGSGALQVFLEAGAGLEATASGIRIKAGEVTDSMLAGSISFSKLADSAVIARLDQAESILAIWNFGANVPQASGVPSSDNDLVNKAYADALAQGLDVKDSVRAVSTSNETLSGLPTTIDGVGSWSAGQRVLLTNQGTGTENGIWEVQSGAWTRPADFDTGDAVAGAFCFVEEGTNYADSGWVCTNNQGSDVVGTNALSFTQFSGAGQITAGAGLTKSGNTLNVGAGNGITVNADDVEVKPDATGGANLAKSIDVNANGVAIKIDDDTIGENGSSQLYVKANSIGANELDETDTYDFSASGSVDVATQTTGDNTTKAASTAFVQQEISGMSTENAVKEMHKITAGEETAGYFTLGQTPISASIVSVTPVGGPQQVNKQIVGATGATPDFDVLNSTELHFNNNGTATGLSEELEADDIVIIEYVY